VAPDLFAPAHFFIIFQKDWLKRYVSNTGRDVMQLQRDIVLFVIQMCHVSCLFIRCTGLGISMQRRHVEPATQICYQYSNSLTLSLPVTAQISHERWRTRLRSDATTTAGRICCSSIALRLMLFTNLGCEIDKYQNGVISTLVTRRLMSSVTER